MSVFQPSTFQVKNEGCDLNYEQLLCFKVFKAVRDLKIFEDQFLVELDQFATNHLLFWSKEVMAAYTMCCFDDGDRNHEHAKRVLIYRFKQLFLHCKATNYNDTVPFEIDWKTYLLQKKGISIDSRQDASVTMFDDGTPETQFLEKLNRYRHDLYNIEDFMDDLDEGKNTIYLDDVKVGEDTGATPAVVEPAPNAIEQILAEPLNLQGGKRKYYGRKTKAAAHKTQRQHKTVQNARRVEGSKKVLAKGYNVMPKDRALQISAGVFVPTIFIDTINAHNQFNQDFPPAERQHGFMVSCKGVVLYWNTLTQDFGPALVDLP